MGVVMSEERVAVAVASRPSAGVGRFKTFGRHAIDESNPAYQSTLFAATSPPPEAAHAATDVGAEPVRCKATSLWFLLLAPLICAVLLVVELAPASRAGWVFLALALGPIAFFGAVAALSRLV